MKGFRTTASASMMRPEPRGRGAPGADPGRATPAAGGRRPSSAGARALPRRLRLLTARYRRERRASVVVVGRRPAAIGAAQGRLWRCTCAYAEHSDGREIRPFILVLQTRWQQEQLLIFGHFEVVRMDSTFGCNDRTVLICAGLPSSTAVLSGAVYQPLLFAVFTVHTTSITACQQRGS